MEEFINRHYHVVKTKASRPESMKLDQRIQGEAFVVYSLSQRRNARSWLVGVVENLASLCSVKAVSWIARGEDETHWEVRVSRNHTNPVIGYCAIIPWSLKGTAPQMWPSLWPVKSMQRGIEEAVMEHGYSTSMTFISVSWRYLHHIAALNAVYIGYCTHGGMYWLSFFGLL
jgi:hypothetical protein